MRGQCLIQIAESDLCSFVESCREELLCDLARQPYCLGDVFRNEIQLDQFQSAHAGVFHHLMHQERSPRIMQPLHSHCYRTSVDEESPECHLRSYRFERPPELRKRRGGLREMDIRRGEIAQLRCAMSEIVLNARFRLDVFQLSRDAQKWCEYVVGIPKRTLAKKLNALCDAAEELQPCIAMIAKDLRAFREHRPRFLEPIHLLQRKRPPMPHDCPIMRQRPERQLLLRAILPLQRFALPPDIRQRLRAVLP